MKDASNMLCPAEKAVELGDLNTGLSKFEGQEGFDFVKEDFKFGSVENGNVDASLKKAAHMAANVTQIRSTLAEWNRREGKVETRDELIFFTQMAKTAANVLPGLSKEAKRVGQNLAAVDPQKLNVKAACGPKAISPAKNYLKLVLDFSQSGNIAGVLNDFSDMQRQLDMMEESDLARASRVKTDKGA